MNTQRSQAKSPVTALIVFLIIVSAIGTDAANGQQASPDGLWVEVEPSEHGRFTVASISKDRELRLNPSRLDALLSSQSEAMQAVLSLPEASGAFGMFTVAASDVITTGSSAAITCWEGFDAMNSDRRVVLTRAADTVLAAIAHGNDVTLIEPGIDGLYRVRSKNANVQGRSLDCLARGIASKERAPAAQSWAGPQLTIRLAIACTGEYARARGSDKAQVKQGVVFTVQRLNQIYGPELGIRFRLVDGFENLLFLDPDTDPFTNDDPCKLIDESQATIDEVIGDKNYDLGHTLSTGAGGLASAGAGQTGMKARGVTGQSAPFADPFDVDYVAHEIAHQFGANHTFNGQDSGCGKDNRNDGTAYEPGSGSTILAYAGICGHDNLQANSDAYFHSASLDEIRHYLTRYIKHFPTLTKTSNRPPVVTLRPDFVIPKATAFRLSPQFVSDPDGDQLAFCWEQLDLGPSTTLGQQNAAGPLFRSWFPSNNATRVCPRIATILRGNLDPAELLPTQARRMRFRITVRDNHKQAGGIAMAIQGVTVSDSAGPFELTFPQEPVIRAGRTNVTWSVAGTDAPPINCKTVNLKLSVDNGASFPYTLCVNTPNDGSELVDLPSFGNLDMRVMLESDNENFFTVSQKFNVLPSDTSILFLPRDDNVSPIELKQMRHLLQTGTLDAVLAINHEFVTLYEGRDSEGARLSYDDAIRFLRNGAVGGRTRSIVALGNRSAMGAFLLRLGGDLSEATGVATLTLSGMNGVFQEFATGDKIGTFKLLSTERTGEWTHDEELIRAAIKSIEVEKLLQEKMRGN